MAKPRKPRKPKKHKVRMLVPAYTMTIGEGTKHARLAKGTVANHQWLGTSKGKPCPTERKSCPIQLVYRNNEPFFRLCTGKKKPGPLIPAGNPNEAYDRAKAICACWERSGKSFDTCVPPGAPIGGAGRRKRK